MTATANAIVQDADSVGTALKTTSLRLRGTDVQVLEDEGLDSDGAVTSKSKLQSKVKALSGVDILTDAGEYKSTYEILSQIADVWKDISDIDQAALLELISGKRNSSVIAAILQNPEELKAAFEDANDSSGSAAKELETYLDSIQGRMDLFTNAVQTMWQNALDSEVIQFLVDVGTWLIKLVDNIGLINSILIATSLIIMKVNKMNLAEFFVSLGTSVSTLNTKLTALATRFGILNTTAATTKASMNGVTVEMFSQRLAAAGVSAENQKLILSKVGLDAANKNQVISSKMTAMAALKEAVANKSLTEVQAFSIAQKLGLITVTKGLNGATTLRIAKLAGLSNAETISLGKTLGVIGATKVLTKEEIKNAIAKAGITDATKAQTLQNLLLLASQGKLIASFKLLGFQIGEWLAKNQLLVTIAAAAAAVYGIIKLFDAFIVTLKEAEEKLSDLNSALEATESKLDDLEDQLKEVQNRIKELNEQPTLTFVDQEELDRLREQNNELERSIGITKQIRAGQQKTVNNQALKTAEKYEDANFKTGKGKGEYMETGATTGGIIGGVAGGIGGIAAGAATTAALTAAGSVVPVVGNIVGFLVGVAISAAGAAVGAGIGTGVGAIVSDASDQVGEAMDGMLEQRKKLEAEYNKAHEAYAKNPTKKSVIKEYEEAEEALANYDSMMSEHMYKLESYYSQIDLSVYDPVVDKKKIDSLRKEINDFYDTQDKWAIQNGGPDAKYNALNRIFGENAIGGFAEARDRIESIREELKKAQKSGKGVDEALAALEGFKLNLSEEEVGRLREMDIYLYEAEDYFKDVVKTESQFIDSDLEDVAKDINKITDGLGALKSAFEEVIEKGVLTAKTVMELKETLKIGDSTDTEELTDAWTEYLNVMMSGVATTEELTEATEEFAQAYLEDALANDALTSDTKLEYVAQLRVLGVTNAEDVVNDMLQRNMVKELEASDAYTKALKQAFEKETNGFIPDEQFDEIFNNLTAEQLADLANKYNVAAKLDADTVTQLAEEYGVAADTVQEIVDKLSEKQKLENDISAIEEQQEAYNSFYESWNEKLEDYRDLEKEIVGVYNSFTEAEKNFDKGEWAVSGNEWTNVKTGEKLYNSEFVARRKKNEEYQKLINSDTYKEYKKLHDELIALQNSEEGKQWLNDDLTLKPGVDADFEKAINEIKDKIKVIDDEIEKELTVDIQLKLDLRNKSELVDEMQEIYDTLANAEKEYNENSGYVSVDTLQSLLQLEPKYLAMLYDENGQLNLNKQTILQVAQARTLDMGIQAAQNIITQASEALEANKISRLKELTEVTYDQADANWALVESNLAALKSTIETRNADVNDEMYGQLGGVYEGIESQVFAIRDLTNKSVANIQNSFSSAGNTATAEAEDAFQKAMDYWENRIGANRSLYEQIQNDIDLLEKKGQIAGESYYQAQMNVENERLEHLKKQREEAGEYLKQFDPGSEKWWEIANTLNDIENEIDDVTLSLQDLKDAMDQVHWDIFNEAHERMDDLQTQLSNVREMLSADEDSFFDDEGKWTETGVAVLGTYIQEIELYKNALADINKELANIDIGDFDSEQEYYDKLTELTEKQHDYTLAISDSEQSIVDMYESSVDAIEEYTQTLVESYNDYIDVVKEALDAERDLYDFKKNVQKQNKDIAELERRIISLSGSTNKSDIAERRKLEAQLYESRESLNDTYYDHAKESQQNALDGEREAYEENMNKFVEGLRTSLEEATANMDEFLMSVTSMVTLNADTVLKKYESTELPLSTALTNPWEAAKKASDSYSGNALDLMNQWTKEGGFFDRFNFSGTENLTSPWNAGKTAATQFGASVKTTMESVYSNVQSNVQSSIRELDKLKAKYAEINDYEGRVNTSGGGGGSPSPDPAPQKKYYTTATLDIGTAVLTSKGVGASEPEAKRAALTAMSDNYYNYKIRHGAKEEAIEGLWSRTKSKIEYNTQYYAKGTLGTKRDEWAVVDELGPELIMHANPKTGRLEYMTKGSSVIPHDATTELIKLADIGADNLMMPKLNSGVNVMTNYITKPEFKIDIEEFVHVERVDQNTLPQLEKMMDKKIDDFSKALNYSLKRFAR